MKKLYQKPEISIVELDACYMLVSSVIIDSDSKGDFTEDFVIAHRGRGVWGDLWKETNEASR